VLSQALKICLEEAKRFLLLCLYKDLACCPLAEIARKGPSHTKIKNQSRCWKNPTSRGIGSSYTPFFSPQRSLVCKLAVTEGRKERQEIRVLAMRTQIDLEKTGLLHRMKRTATPRHWPPGTVGERIHRLPLSKCS
jgi:hypothetical protein